MNTLVIDDDPFALKLIVRQLTKLAAPAVIPCRAAREALDLLESGRDTIGLIVVDLQMPEMDGVEFLRHLARIGYSGQLVLVSGEDARILQAAVRLARAHALNVLGAMSKPVALEHLRELLKPGISSAAPPPRRTATYEPDALRRAIADGELVDHYQPKVDLATGAVVGVETLIRWQHPRDGLVFPDQFIPVAEQNELIDDLTAAVLAAAIRRASAWREAGLRLQVAVNVSMENLHALEFPELVIRESRKTEFPVTDLMLEVTESRLMSDPLASLDILTRLRLKRIGLSIDDFGTGHSSLAQLRDLPFEEIKVDRSFVHGAWRDEALRAILEASLGMGRQLGMKTVAEGVEDVQDWAFLRAAGCDVAQGYFISRPMPGPALPEWIARWEARRAELAGPRA